jgi:opacity protein-like surface antigen
MKNFLAIFILSSTISLSTKGQDAVNLKPFKVDVSIGYAIPGGEGVKGGIVFAVEPKYAVIPNLAVGLRMEGAIIAKFSGYDEDGNAMNTKVKAAGSYLATGDYYFTNNYALRPFAGAGAGIFSIAGIEVNSSSEKVSGGSEFGGMVRAGIEAGHFRIGVEYNIVPKTTFEGYDSNGNYVTGLTSDNSYIGIKIGACIGGGRK